MGPGGRFAATQANEDPAMMGDKRHITFNVVHFTVQDGHSGSSDNTSTFTRDNYQPLPTHQRSQKGDLWLLESDLSIAERGVFPPRTNYATSHVPISETQHTAISLPYLGENCTATQLLAIGQSSRHRGLARDYILSRYSSKFYLDIPN